MLALDVRKLLVGERFLIIDPWIVPSPGFGLAQCIKRFFCVLAPVGVGLHTRHFQQILWLIKFRAPKRLVDLYSPIPLVSNRSVSSLD